MLYWSIKSSPFFVNRTYCLFYRLWSSMRWIHFSSGLIWDYKQSTMLYVLLLLLICLNFTCSSELWNPSWDDFFYSFFVLSCILLFFLEAIWNFILYSLGYVGGRKPEKREAAYNSSPLASTIGVREISSETIVHRGRECIDFSKENIHRQLMLHWFAGNQWSTDHYTL